MGIKLVIVCACVFIIFISGDLSEAEPFGTGGRPNYYTHARSLRKNDELENRTRRHRGLTDVINLPGEVMAFSPSAGPQTDFAGFQYLHVYPFVISFVRRSVRGAHTTPVHPRNLHPRQPAAFVRDFQLFVRSPLFLHSHYH